MMHASKYSKAQISLSDLSDFTENLSFLLEAGLPLVEALSIIKNQSKRGILKGVLTFLINRINNGFSFSSSLSYCPKIFDPIYINLVKAGENSGKLQSNLYYLSTHFKKLKTTQKTIQSACLYPSIVLSVAFMVMAFVILWIVPRFELLFQQNLNMGQLPSFTRILLNLSYSIRSHIGFCVLSFLLIVLCVWYCFKKFISSGTSKYFLKWPIIGELLIKINLARFTYCFAMLLKSGLETLDALILSRNTLNLNIFKIAFQKIEKQIQQGVILSAAIKRQNIFPQSLYTLIEIGEKSGDLSKVLEAFSRMNQEQSEDLLKKLTTLIEPILIILLAIIIGSIILALFLPMLHFMQNLG